MKIEGFLEPDVWHLEKSIFAVLRMKRIKVSMCDLNPNSICIGYKEVRTKKENTSSLNFEHIESGSKGTVHAEI